MTVSNACTYTKYVVVDIVLISLLQATVDAGG